MKILQAIHDFLPRHQAGSELYCYHLSRSLQTRGHDVTVFYSEIDHDQPNYSITRKTFDELPCFEVINNHEYRAFEDTYRNADMENAFRQCLDEVQPDVVHFHHLLSLSYGCVSLCNERGIPVVFTLHDYWLTCPRGGGQRFRGEGKVCHEVDPALCASCISRYAFPHTGIRLVKKIISLFENETDPTLLGTLSRGTIETENHTFVSVGTSVIEHDQRRVLFAHPKSSVRIKAVIPEHAVLQFSYAMDPSTYTQDGGGVRFEIRVDGKAAFEATLDAKTNTEDRGWHEGRIDLSSRSGKRAAIEFRTTATGDDNHFCTAMWAEPRLIQRGRTAYTPPARSRIQAWGETLLSRWQQRGMQSRVEDRRRSTLHLFNSVDLFIAPSPFLRKTFIEYGMPEERIVYSDYGIANAGYKNRLREPEQPLRFTFVGTLVEHKGVHTLIEAFQSLPDDCATLDVYGSLDEFTGYVNRLRSMATHPGIRFCGRAENEDIPGILARTDALLVPSIWFENSPITIHEAFLAQVPVITSRFGGMADLVRDGENGLLFEVGNASSLAEVLLRCVETPSLLNECRPDPDEVKTLAADSLWMEEQYKKLLSKRTAVG